MQNHLADGRGFHAFPNTFQEIEGYQLALLILWCMRYGDGPQDDVGAQEDHKDR